MAGISKLFYEHVQHTNCQTFGLHSSSCKRQMLTNLISFAQGNFKYFIPLSLLPLLTQWRHMDREKLRQSFDNYMKCSVMGTAMALAILTLVCFFRNIFGRFHVLSFLFLPASIGGLLINFGSPRVKDIYETAMFQCNIDSFFLARRNPVSRLIADSPVAQTYVFMLCSAIILQGKRLYNLKGFWLLSPNRKLPQRENRESNKCELHEQGSCYEYLFEGMRKYFALGITLDMIKALMGKVDVPQNQSKLLAKLKNVRIRSTALLTVYMGLYRFTHCFLNRHFNRSDSLNHLTSGFLAGICYYLYPQSTLFSYSLVQAIRTLWSILKTENADTKHPILQRLFRIPFARILYPFALGNSVHLMCLKPEYCSPLTHTITNSMTSNYPTIVQNQMKLIKQNLENLKLQ